MATQVNKEWGITRSNRCWQSVVQMGSWWQCCPPFKAEVFIWRVIVGGLALGVALRKRSIAVLECVCFAQFQRNIVDVNLSVVQ